MKFLYYLLLSISVMVCAFNPLCAMHQIVAFEKKLAVIRKTALDRCLLNSDSIIISELITGEEIRIKDELHDDVCKRIFKLLEDRIEINTEETTYPFITIHCKRDGTSIVESGKRAHHIWQSLQEYKIVKS